MSKASSRERKAKEEVNAPETPEDKFARLACKRTNKAITYISYVGNCFGVGYKWSPEQAARVIVALTDAVADIQAKASKTERVSHGFDW